MTDYIDRKAFIEDIKAEITNLKLNGLKGTPRPCDELYDFIDRIKEQPSVDNVVPVIRCKDCDYFKEDATGINFQGYCFWWSSASPESLLAVSKDGFCNNGRKDGKRA